MPASVKPIACLDLDGPIIDVSNRHYRVFYDGVCRLGGAPISQEEFWNAKRNRIPDIELLTRSGIPDSYGIYSSFKIEAIESSPYLAYDQLQPGAHAILRMIAM